MKLLTNRKIRLLYYRVLLFITAFTLVSFVVTGLHPQGAVLWILTGALVMGASILAALYRYFSDQNKIMEDAVLQIKDYMSGNQDARIECEEEGELYTLFHEVNSLVSILNAHAQKEGKARNSLKAVISDISHQLKTPIAALNIYNGIVQEETKYFPEVQKFTALSEQELDRIQILVQNLLIIAKLDAGTIMMEKTEENVSEIMSSIQKHFLYRSRQEGKKLHLYGDDAVTFLCDRTWFMEAVGNLVKNAFDHTQKGDTVQIEWKEFASIIQIVVKDNGSGIHPEDIYHIFKRFYRSRFSKDTQGTGLGLPLAKAIVEEHNGTIEVDSEPGIGTSFIINLLIPTKL